MRAAGVPSVEFAGGAVRRPGKTGRQLADLEPVWHYTAPGGPQEIYTRTRSCAISGHQADDISVHAIGPARRREHPVIPRTASTTPIPGSVSSAVSPARGSLKTHWCTAGSLEFAEGALVGQDSPLDLGEGCSHLIVLLLGER